MKKKVDFVEGWLEQNRDQIVQCPNQPGQLKLTMEACIQRHWAAQTNCTDVRWMNPPRNLSDRAKDGLALCLQCPIGEQLSFSNPSGQQASLGDEEMKRVVILEEKSTVDSA
jgi:hypothetical protein